MPKSPDVITPAWRHHLVMFLFVLVALGLLARLLDLQVLQNDFLANEGAMRQIGKIESAAVRGSIFDRNGEPLAISTPVDTIGAEPAVVLQQPQMIPRLAHLLGREPQELREYLQQRTGRKYVRLKRQLEPQQAAAVQALGIRGIETRREYKRFYPAAEVTAQVVGYTDIDEHGREGLELAYNEWLAAKPGKRLVVRNLKGQVVEDVEQVKAPQPGRDLYTSIDLRLQYIANRAVKRAMQLRGARSVSAVLLDSRTGEVLAMVNQPSYNPNLFKDRASFKSRNRAVTDLFEPGSTIKPLTLLVALASGKFNERTVIDTSPGYWSVGGHTIHDHKNYHQLDLTGILRKSSNVGASHIALELPAEDLWANLLRFGFGSRTGLGFPGEVAGRVRHFSQWYPLDQATVSYGYGFSATLTQLARAYSAFANHGCMPHLSLLQLDDNAAKCEQIMEPELAQRMLAMLEQTISVEGTGRRAAVQGFRVAGKTGTVRKLGAEGYTDERYTAIFTGIAPASDPRLVLAVVVDEPQGKQYSGGAAAAPAFAEIMSNALRVLNITPDHLAPSLVNAERPEVRS